MVNNYIIHKVAKTTQFRATDTSVPERIKQILDLLRGEYGVPECPPHSDPLSVLIKTILSQNTSDANSGSAFQLLLDSFHNWDEVVDADVDTVAHCIRGGGLGRIKAQRIKQALGEITRLRGELDLDFMRQLTPPDAEDWLLKLPGIGLKTARCVLLFSLGMPILPVDTHIFRVSKRLMLIDFRASLPEAHYILGEAVPPADVYQFHILLIQHGRKICQARKPNCNDCVLKEICMSYNP